MTKFALTFAESATATVTAVCAGSSRTGSVNPDRERAVSNDKIGVIMI